MGIEKQLGFGHWRGGGWHYGQRWSEIGSHRGWRNSVSRFKKNKQDTQLNLNHFYFLMHIYFEIKENPPWDILILKAFFFLAAPSLLLCGAFCRSREWGLLSSCDARASRRSGFSYCRAQTLTAWAWAGAACELCSCGFSVFLVCGILHQRSNPCPLHL